MGQHLVWFLPRVSLRVFKHLYSLVDVVKSLLGGIAMMAVLGMPLCMRSIRICGRMLLGILLRSPRNGNSQANGQSKREGKRTEPRLRVTTVCPSNYVHMYPLYGLLCLSES
jgi:hypothetical protein